VVQALERTDEAQKASRLCCEPMLQPSSLREFLKRLPAVEDVETEERAFEPVAKHADLNGTVDELFNTAAEQLSADDALAASLALRCMVNFTLKGGRSSRYGHAGDHLQAANG
jgi:hypothetical protein